MSIYEDRNVHIGASKTSLKQDIHSLLIKAVQRP